ncbi:MAG TPA: ABC transporter permease [Gammaproteobacteria bacterium]|nr:ABC transporter permease [Gammaproteobacteria bacterium]
MVGLLEAIGRKALNAAGILREMAGTTGLCGVRALLPASYNPAVRLVLTRQVYFTAVQILPLFLTVALLFGVGVVGAVVAGILRLDLVSQAGTLVVDLLVLELAPLITALLIGLRSGSAINAEMAAMALAGEFRTLDLFAIDRTTYLMLPRVLAAMTAVPLLTGIFALVALISAYLYLFVFDQTALGAYLDAVTAALTGPVAGLLLAKSLLLGFLVAFIPLYSGSHAPAGLTGISIAVLRGMVRLFLALFLVEIATLGVLWL